MKADKITDSNLQGLYGSLQEFAALCCHKFDNWVRQHIIDDDPYDHYEQERVKQKYAQAAESWLLYSITQNNPNIQN
jgi:hypothetical protein